MTLQSPNFFVLGVCDKILTKKGIRYLFFYEFDGDRHPEETFEHERLFKTRNGWHIVYKNTVSAEEKRFHHQIWHDLYPSDYELANMNTLMPHSQEELDFILKQAAGAQIMIVEYYRDKGVLESWAAETISG